MYVCAEKAASVSHSRSPSLTIDKDMSKLLDVIPPWGSRKDKDKEKKGKMRKTNTSSSTDDNKAATDKATTAVPEKRQRKKWTEEETQMLVTGCNIVRISVCWL